MPDFDKLDKAIHEKGRLSIMTLLATRMAWSFQDLKAELNMSDGNLITHLADFAQTRIGGGDEGNSGSSANELCPDGEGALSLSGVSAGVGANCESREKMTAFVMSSAVETSLIIFSDKVRDSSVRAGLAFSLGMTRSGKKIKFCARAL